MKSSVSLPTYVDPLVTLTLAFFVVAGVFAMVFKHYKNESFDLSIAIDKDILYAGEIVHFEATTQHPDRDNIVWEFSNSGSNDQKGRFASHSFEAPGRYEIIARVNNRHLAYKTVFVEMPPVIVKDEPRAFISFPERIEEGQPAKFIDKTPGATKWEWRFDGSRLVNATTREVTHIFSSEGHKKVSLIVNDQIMGQEEVYVHPKKLQNQPRPKQPIAKPIEVNPRPIVEKREPVEEPSQEPPKEEPTYPKFNRLQIEKELVKVIEGEGDLGVLMTFFCNDRQQSQIVLNSEVIDFQSFEAHLRDIKRVRRIKELSIGYLKDEETNCLKLLSVNLERKGLLGF